jgi:hypothetical protein
MPRVVPNITRLVHENFWIVLSFAFGQPAIARIIDQRFAGEWKFLNRTVHENTGVRANRALLEMGLQLRVLDDEEGLSDVFKKTERPPLGSLVRANGTQTDLHFRDVTNKIIHGSRYEWRLGNDDPSIVIHADAPEKWQSAEVRIVDLMAHIGGLGF